MAARRLPATRPAPSCGGFRQMMLRRAINPRSRGCGCLSSNDPRAARAADGGEDEVTAICPLPLGQIMKAIVYPHQETMHRILHLLSASQPGYR